MITRIKYIALFLKHIENSYELVGKKLINITNDKIIFNNIKYPLKDLAIHKPISKKFKKYYFIDINKGFIDFEIIKSEMNLDVVDMFIGKDIFSTTFSTLMNPKLKRNYFDLIIGGIIGVLLGFVLAKYLIV